MLVLALALSVAACGGDDDDDTARPDANITTTDAPVTVDAAPSCTIETPQFTTMPVDNQNALAVDFATQNPPFISFRLLTGNEPDGDWLSFDHEKPVTLNQDIDLSGGCTQGSAYCMLLLGDYRVDQQAGKVDGEQIFLALSGTINITQADDAAAQNPRFKATVTNAVFKRFEKGPNGLVDANDTVCTSTIASMTIDVGVVAPSGKPTKADQAPLNVRPPLFTIPE